MPTPFITAQQAANSSQAIQLVDGQSIQVFCAPLLKSGEYVNIEHTDGTNWYVTRVAGNQVHGLTARITRIGVTGPGTFRVTKSQTEEAVAVYYDG